MTSPTSILRHRPISYRLGDPRAGVTPPDRCQDEGREELFQVQHSHARSRVSRLKLKSNSSSERGGSCEQSSPGTWGTARGGRLLIPQACPAARVSSRKAQLPIARRTTRCCGWMGTARGRFFATLRPAEGRKSRRRKWNA